MAKEIIPNTPIPISTISGVNIDDTYCASRMDCSDNSFSSITTELVKYLEFEYDNVGYGGNTRSFIAKDSNIDTVKNNIINHGISGINKNTFDNHLILNQIDSDVIIFVNLY